MTYSLTYKGHRAASTPAPKDLTLGEHAILVIIEDEEETYHTERDIARVATDK